MDSPNILSQSRPNTKDNALMPMMEFHCSPNSPFRPVHTRNYHGHNERHGHTCTTPTPISPHSSPSANSYDESMESFSQFSPPPLNQSATTTPSSSFLSNTRHPEFGEEIDVDDSTLMIPMLDDQHMDNYDGNYDILVTPPTNQSYYITFPHANADKYSRPILKRRTTSRTHLYGKEESDMFRSAIHDPTAVDVPRSIDFSVIPNLDSLTDDDNDEEDHDYDTQDENQDIMRLSLSLPKGKHRPLPRFPLVPRKLSRDNTKM